MGKYDLKSGDRFGRLTITWDRETRNKVIYEKCICDCGNTKRVSRYHLIRWKIRSCWCLARDETKKRNKKLNTKHWMFWTKFYSSYMRAYWRCNNPNNPSYHNYWGRWIKFLWNNFEEFYNDMYLSFKIHYDKYWAKDTSLDRIDVNGDYCKENCRWATYLEQQINRRDNVKIIYKWKEYPTVTELSKSTGVAVYIIRNRLKYWRSVDDIIEVPVWMTRKKFHWW